MHKHAYTAGKRQLVLITTRTRGFRSWWVEDEHGKKLTPIRLGEPPEIISDDCKAATPPDEHPEDK